MSTVEQLEARIAAANVDVSGFAAGMAVAASAFSKASLEVAMTAERAAVQLSALQEAARRSVADEPTPWQRRRRRYATHVFEVPRRSRMHAAYRAKTRGRRAS